MAMRKRDERRKEKSESRTHTIEFSEHFYPIVPSSDRFRVLKITIERMDNVAEDRQRRRIRDATSILG